ncbi:uncharacterized protein LOC129583929 [Paramacrobiotus metropolitanus]|uniref:uncharacterized protein LOC129583929 n=1 Tax=Paramacrobiotus metropolitanus TaxID=2943436 RepID=UPI0024456B78|nr:uncharacterized protein LOC129583929 [Paramacrobiotus metropolitanus]
MPVDPYRVRAQKLKTSRGTALYGFTVKAGALAVVWTVVCGVAFWYYKSRDPDYMNRVQRRFENFDIIGLNYKITELDLVIHPKIAALKSLEQLEEEGKFPLDSQSVAPRKKIPQIAPLTTYPLGDEIPAPAASK